MRGGHIIPLQQPGNTTTASRNNSFSMVVALDNNGTAKGDLYLDDGESLTMKEYDNYNIFLFCYFL